MASWSPSLPHCPPYLLPAGWCRTGFSGTLISLHVLQLLTLGEEGLPITGLCGWRQPCPVGLQGVPQTLQILRRGLEEARFYDGDEARFYDGDLYPKRSDIPPEVGAEGGFWVLALTAMGCSGTWVGGLRWESYHRPGTRVLTVRDISAALG